MKVSKCEFGVDEIEFLGHKLDKFGIKPLEDKVVAINKFPVPRTVTNVKSFMGLVNYYRSFIPNCSIIAAPLFHLTHKNVKFVWDDKCQKSFELLKEKLVSAPVLMSPDPNAEYYLSVDASTEGIGGILEQKNEKGELHPVAFISRILNKNEKNYSVTELEALAIIHAIKKLGYLINNGKNVHINTDHNALKWLLDIKNPSGRLSRWALQLQPYKHLLKINYVKGTKQNHVDCLSRNAIKNEENVVEEKDETDIRKIITGISTYIKAVISELDDTGMRAAQLEEDYLKYIIFAKQNKSLDEFNLTKEQIQNIRNSLDKYYINADGILYRQFSAGDHIKYRLVIPKSLQSDVLYEYHDSKLAGHSGIARTLTKIGEKYWWYGMNTSVKNYIAHCLECQQKKPRHTDVVVPGVKRDVVPIAFHTIGIDFIERLPTTSRGHSNICNIHCHFTKYEIAEATKTKSALDAAKVLVEKVILVHGAPSVIVSDQGTAFMSALIAEINNLMNIKRKNTAAYNPRANGIVERSNKTMMEAMSYYCNKKQSNWDELIPYAVFAYNSTKNATTGYSPYYLLHGREPVLPLDIILKPFDIDNISAFDYVNDMKLNFSLAYAAVDRAIKKSGENYEKRSNENKKLLEFKIGDKVWLLGYKQLRGTVDKLKAKWLGPMEITGKLSGVSYKIKAVNDPREIPREQVVHVSRLKKANIRETDSNDVEPINVLEEVVLPTEQKEEMKQPEIEEEIEFDHPIMEVPTIQPRRSARLNKPIQQLEPLSRSRGRTLRPQPKQVDTGLNLRYNEDFPLEQIQN